MVKPKNLSVEWTLMAKDDFKHILLFYKKRSQQGYKLVKAAVLDTIKQARLSPEIYVADSLKDPKDNAIRVFTVYHTRVSYIIEKNKIIILRLRHTSQEPKSY